MNQKQLKVLWTGVVIIALMLLIPPWEYVFDASGRLRIEKAAPYGFVFSPPEIPVTSRNGDARCLNCFEGRSRQAWSVQVDWDRLVLPVCVVGVLTFARILTFRVPGGPSKE